MFIGMVRVKNETKYIERSVRSLLNVCEEVHVLDDHSTDDTAIKAIDAGCSVYPSPFPEDSLNESRDKTWLLDRVVESLPPGNLSQVWVISIDGDEEICYRDLERLRSETRQREVSYSFRILTLYDSPAQIRVDGVYANMTRPSMFRLIRPNMTFKSNGRYGGGFHCTNVPADIGFLKKLHEPPIRVLHYGYMEKENRERKYEFYLKHDPKHVDWYQRECLGVPTLAPLGI